MYKSPIDVSIARIYKDVMTAEENAVMSAVVKCGINVDKDELVKALAYDRGQYEKGYADAKAELMWHGKWIEKSTGGEHFWCCSECGYIEWDAPNNYCPNSGADMRGEAE